MARNGWFRRRSQAVQKAEQVPEGLWTKCPKCETILFAPELERNLHVCPRCGHQSRLRVFNALAEHFAYLLGTAGAILVLWLVIRVSTH